MTEILAFLNGNMFYVIFIGFFIITGGADVLGRVLSGHRKITKLKAENKAQKYSIERADNLIDKLSSGQLQLRSLASGGSEDATATSFRMARLLDKVQTADDALPQLDGTLRGQIDVELDVFHSAHLVTLERKP